MLLRKLVLALLTLLYRTDPDAMEGIPPRSTLFLIVDGADIPRPSLLRWAGRDWPRMVDYLDVERDGITVQPMLSGRQDREVIIAAILRRIQEDLGPYGIKVVRHTGPVVEGAGATTLFLGSNTLSIGSHIACDVDMWNDNATDVAFIQDEDWGSAMATATALADVCLHEAGHTWGLYHVDCRRDGVIQAESMGLRYSAPQSEWVRDTRYLNISFPEYRDHGSGRGPQNAHRIMMATFRADRREPARRDEPRLPIDALRDCFGKCR